jgi:hypothetical protein
VVFKHDVRTKAREDLAKYLGRLLDDAGEGEGNHHSLSLVKGGVVEREREARQRFAATCGYCEAEYPGRCVRGSPTSGEH